MILAALVSLWGHGPAFATDPCIDALPRSPRVVTARDFRPLPRTCRGYAPERCTVRATPRRDAPEFATYRLSCAKEEVQAAPTAPRVDPALTTLKRGRWIEGASVIVPEDAACTSPDQVRRNLESSYPTLARARTAPAEPEPRLRVWSLRAGDGGYVELSQPGMTEPAFGRAPGRLPEDACRSPVTVDSREVTPRTQIIVASCRGAPPPDLTHRCGGRSGVMNADARRLATGARGDRGVAYLEMLAASDAEVAELEAAGPPEAPPPAEPVQRYACNEKPRPVPLQHMLAVWPGGRRSIHRAAEASVAGTCATVAADLDPQGDVLALVSRHWEEPNELEVLRELWQLDPVLGGELLTALDAAVGRNPALRAADLHAIARTALQTPRGFRPDDVAAYERERQRLLTRLTEAEPVLARIPERAVDARDAFEAFAATVERWPSHARELLDPLEDRRKQVGRALREPRFPRRRAGKALILELHDLIGRIEADDVHRLHNEIEAIDAALDGGAEGLLSECRAVLIAARAELDATPETTLEAALRDPATFRERRDRLTDAHRRLDEEVCAKAELRTSLMGQRVRNLEVESSRVTPSHPVHPSRAGAERLLRRCDDWLRRINRR